MAIKNYILNLNDDLLAKLSSKGLLKRAYKDYEEKGIIPEIIEDSHKIVWKYKEQGIECSLASADLMKAICTCPSSGICRHILTGVIHLQKFPGGIIPEEECVVSSADSSDPWERLYSADDKELKELRSKKSLEKCFMAISEGVKIEIKKEKNILEASFPDMSITCSFLPFTGPGAGICSCKKNSCEHELMAILKLQIDSGKREIMKKETRPLSPGALNILKVMEDLVKELLITGLERSSIQTLNQLDALSLEAHNENMPRIDKVLRKIKSHIELYLNKNAFFDRNNYILELSRIYGIIKILENYDGTFPLSDITGIYKSSYMEAGNLRLSGAGCSAWKAMSGYTGITAYFLDEKKSRWFTFTLSRPEFYEGAKFNPFAAYKSEFPWEESISLQSLSRKHLILSSASKNRDGRLSSSKNTGVKILDFVTPEDLPLSPLCITGWSRLVDEISKIGVNIYKREKENSGLFLLKICDLGKPEFDEVKQEFEEIIYDEEGNGIYLKIPFTPLNKTAIENLEEIYKKNVNPIFILGHVYIQSGFIRILPVTLYFDFFHPVRGYSLNLNLDKFNL